MEKFRVKKSGRSLRRILIISIISVLIPLIVIGGLMTYKYVSFIQEKTKESMLQAAVDKKHIFLNAIDAAKTESYILSQNISMIEVLSSINYDKKSIAEIEQYIMKAYIFRNGLYDNIYVSDAKGRIIADAKNGELVGTMLGSIEFFLDSKKGNQYVSDIIESNDSRKSLIAIGTPIYDNMKNCIGVLGVNINYEKLALDIFGSNSGVYRYGLISGENLPRFTFIDEDNNKQAICYSSIEDSNWYIFSSMSAKDFYSPINKITKYLVILILGCITSFLLVFSMSSKKNTNIKKEKIEELPPNVIKLKPVHK